MAEYIERTEKLMLAMNAGARAIENTKRYHGAIYNKDLFSEKPQEIPYLQAVKVLREISDAPVADVAPVIHAHWIHEKAAGGFDLWRCSHCGAGTDQNPEDILLYCFHCGAEMDGGDDGETD